MSSALCQQRAGRHVNRTLAKMVPIAPESCGTTPGTGVSGRARLRPLHLASQRSCMNDESRRRYKGLPSVRQVSSSFPRRHPPLSSSPVPQPGFRLVRRLRTWYCTVSILSVFYCVVSGRAMHVLNGVTLYPVTTTTDFLLFSLISAHLP